MARFMLAHLQDGALGDGRILKPETAQMMHTRVMSPDPALNGHALGFYETYINGHRIIGHGGDTQFFHSVLSLMPETGLGLFASVNTGGQGGRTSVELERAFFKHYYPAELPVVKPPADAAKRNARYAGSYRTLRHSYTKFEKVFAAFGDDEVAAMPDGTLMMGDIFGNPARWVEVGDGVFRQQNGDAFAAFKGDDGGKATARRRPVPADRFPAHLVVRVGKLHGFIVGIALLLFITTLVSAIRQRRADNAARGQLRWARPTLALSGVLLLLFLLVIAAILAGGFQSLIYKIPTVAVRRADAAAARDSVRAARRLVRRRRLALGHVDVRHAPALLARGSVRAAVPGPSQLLESPWLPFRLNRADRSRRRRRSTFRARTCCSSATRPTPRTRRLRSVCATGRRRSASANTRCRPRR